MWACLVLCVAAALVGAVCAECDACIYGRCYRKHRLPLSEDDRAGLLDIDRNKNFLYVRHEGTMKQCQLDTGACNGTGNTWNMWSFTVDHRSGDTYGRIHEDTGHDGLYKLDLINNVKELLFHGSVDYITFRSKLYYSRYRTGLYTFEDGESRIVNGTEGYYILDYVVDNKDDIYFRTFLNGRYDIRWLSKGVVEQNVYWDSHYLITLDRDGNAVFIDNESRAVYRVTNGEQVEIGTMDDLTRSHAPLFDRDNNYVYENSLHDVFHVKQVGDVNCTTSIIDDKPIIIEIIMYTDNTTYSVSTTSIYNIEPTASRSPGENTENEDHSFQSPPADSGPT